MGGIAGSLSKKSPAKKRRVSVVLVAVAIASASCAVLAFEAWELQRSSGAAAANGAAEVAVGRPVGEKRPKTADTALALTALPTKNGGNGAVADDVVPECPGSPWKEDENMVGTCPGTVKKYKGSPPIHDAASCARVCCDSAECVTWQFRRDVGCLHGPDTRLGMEKDGVSAWCSDHPPYRWSGQYVLERSGGKVTNDRRSTVCNLKTWNPREVEGQCFGLGDVRTERASESAERCMEACCADETCGAWQWQKDKGCFYNKRMHGCQDASNPVAFEPFVGRRKFLPSRKYVDKSGKPWKQVL